MIRFGAAVGSERVIFCHAHPRGSVGPGDIEGYARTLAAIGREAHRAGVQLSLHHHFDQPVMHRPDFDQFFGAIDDDAVMLTIDTAHLVKSGIADIAEVIDAFGPRIDTVHLKDIRDGRFIPLGEGTIAFGPVFAAIGRSAPGAWLCADEESGADIAGAMIGHPAVPGTGHGGLATGSRRLNPIARRVSQGLPGPEIARCSLPWAPVSRCR